jgi:hypothetical protein
MSKRKPKDRSREILERIVGTKSKATLAEAFKMAFAEKYDVKRDEIKQGIVDKVYNKEKVAFGELGHPDGPTVNLERVSHMITSLKPEGKNFIGEAKIMDTPYGKIVKNLIDEGAQLGVSSRGMGSISNGTVGKDFYLATAADIVADPSAPDAFVEGIMEGKEWVWDNGVLKSKTVEAYKHEIEKARLHELTEVKSKIFADFISKL